MRSHGGVLAQLAELIDQLPDDTDAETLIGLRKIINQAEAKCCRQIRNLDARQDYAAPEWACETMAALLRHYCHLAPQDASQHVRISRLLPSFPDTEAAFTAGDISFRHAAIITDLARKTSLEDAKLAEPVLLPLALASHPGQLRTAAKHVQHCLDPDGSLAEHEKQVERRYLDLVQTFAGMWHLEGAFDPEAGAKLKTALDAIMGIPPRDDPRTRQQREADAMIELADVAMAADTLPTRGRRRPQVTITLSLDTLQETPGSPPAEMDGCATPIPVQVAQRYACDAEITRIIFGPESEILDVGRAKRVAHPALDKAVRLRDKTCRWETCDRPAQHCEIHHETPWWAGGRTDLINMMMVCGYHHRLIHEGKQPLRIRPIMRT
jgi:Domain of unknown function (DUF222)